MIIKNAEYSGDGECGFIKVDEESYKLAVGNKRYKNDLGWKTNDIKWARNEYEDAKNDIPTSSLVEYAERELTRSLRRANIWSIYLDDIFLALGIDCENEIVDLEIRILDRRKK